MSTFCSECGHKLAAKAKFCTGCGAKCGGMSAGLLGNEAAGSVAAAEIPQGVLQAPPTFDPNQGAASMGDMQMVPPQSPHSPHQQMTYPQSPHSPHQQMAYAQNIQPVQAIPNTVPPVPQQMHPVLDSAGNQIGVAPAAQWTAPYQKIRGDELRGCYCFGGIPTQCMIHWTCMGFNKIIPTGEEDYRSAGVVVDPFQIGCFRPFSANFKRVPNTNSFKHTYKVCKSEHTRVHSWTKSPSGQLNMTSDQPDICCSCKCS